MNRYVQTLLNEKYRKIMNMTRDDAMQEISRLYDIRISLQQFDHVVGGKRTKKNQHFDMNLKLK